MGVESLNCKCCGGVLKAEGTVCECEYCGAVNVITGDTGKYINQLNRANKLRQGKEFDRALKIYDDILAANPPSADILWERTLCEYGIEYVLDPLTNRYIPTLHRIKDESILNYYSYLEAIEIADINQKKIIENEANEIAKIQNEYLDIVRREKPYDVFICYKETDDSTRLQKEDSGLALDLYERLENYGFKVFFARVTLQDKIGVNYEPYIFGALNSSKVMVVIGTKAEYFSSVWVKNEWSRFLKLMEKDKRKQMFFACDYVEDLPKAFNGRQAQLLNQPNAIQNLAFIVKRCLEQINDSSVTSQSDIKEKKQEEDQAEQRRNEGNNAQKINAQQTQNSSNTTTYNYGYGYSNKKKTQKKKNAALPIVIIIIIVLACCPCGSCLKYVIKNNDGISNDSKSIWADDYSRIEDFEYSLDGDNLSLTGYKSNKKKVRINSSYVIDGKERKVVALEGTFALERVDSVIIPEGVKRIRGNTFNSCGIKYLYMPSTLEDVDSNFWGYFHGASTIYFGGTEEQWKALCTENRGDISVNEIVYEVDINSLK